jgi:multidrug efflux pump subunit AcrA (membrane-fusion protein)
MAVVRRVAPRPAVLSCAAVVALSLTAASCGDEPSTVALGSASRATVTEVVDAPASVTARAAATLTAPADGILTQVRVEPGDRVRKGQVVAVIDSPSAERRLEQAQDALAAGRGAAAPRVGTAGLARLRRSTDAEAEAAFATAREAAEKVPDPEQREQLHAQLAAARKRYAASSRAAGEAVSSVQRGVAGIGRAVSALGAAQRLQAEQAYELAAAAVDALTLRAPIGGVVQAGGTAGPAGAGSLTGLLSGAATGVAPPGAAAATGTPAGVDAAVGEGGYVSVGAPVLTIVDTDRLGVVAEVDETDVLLVEPGTAADIELDAAPGASYAGEVRSVDVLPTGSARGGVAYRVRLSLGKGAFADGRTAPAPRPGMSAVARLRVRQAAGAVTVPAGAVFSADGREAVWVVRDGRAQRADVTLGVQGEDVVEVVSGVGEGERVVVGGADQVRQGQQVP